VLASTLNCVSAQVVLSIDNASPESGEVFSIDVSVSGFDSLSSAQFRLKWDPTVIRLDEHTVPIDSIFTESPFRINPEPNRITFLFESDDGIGEEGSLEDESVLLRLFFTAIGEPGDSTCLMVDPSAAVEFIKLATEELSSTVNTGCVHLQVVNSIPSHEQQKINCYWQSDDRLLISHFPSAKSAFVQVITLDGRVVEEIVVAPFTNSTSILVDQFWQRGILAVRYLQNGHSHSRLIAGPR